MLPQTQRLTGKIVCSDLKPYHAVVPVILRAFHRTGPSDANNWTLVGCSFAQINIVPWNLPVYEPGHPAYSYTDPTGAVRSAAEAALSTTRVGAVTYYNSWMPYGTQVADGFVGNISSLECKSSRNSLNWSGPKGPRVGMLQLTKPKLPMKRPIPPQVPFLAYKPELPTRKPVSIPLKLRQQRRGETADSYQRYSTSITTKQLALQKKLDTLADARLAKALREYELRKDLVIQKNLLTRQRFTKAMQKYNERQLRFERFQERLKTAEFSKTKSGTPVHTDNPYGYLLLVPSGPGLPGMCSRQLFSNGQVAKFRELNTPILLGTKAHNTTCLQALDATRSHFFAIADRHLVEVDDRLIRKLYSKLGNQKVHIGNLLAERKQTFDMFKDVLQRLLTLVRLKGHVLGLVAKYVKNPKMIANDVLAFKFGAEPLMNDLEKLAEDLNSASSDSPIVAVRTNYGGFRTETLEFTEDGYSFSGKVVVSYVMKMSLDSSFAKTLQEYGLVSHVEILWEVTPWSFVIDWLLPVGQWIAACSADVGMTFVTMTRKVKLVGEFVIPPTPASFSGPVGTTNYGHMNIYGIFHGTMINRTVLDEMPDRNRILRLKSPWSWSHGIESVALMVQRLFGTKGR